MALASFRKSLKIGLVLAVWAVFCFGYFYRYPFPEWLARAFFVASAVLALSAAAGYGWPLTVRVLPPVATTPERLLFSVGTGLGILCLALMLMGTIGLWTPAGAVALLAGGLLTGRFARTEPRVSRAKPSSQFGSSIPFPWILIAMGAALSFLLAFAPITYYDSLVYHLALPQAYVQAGRWVGQPELIYSAFPQNLEMLWMLGLLLGSDAVANLIGWGVGMGGLAAVYLYGKRFLSASVGVWAAAALAVMPAYLLLSAGGYIDVGLAFFSFLSLYALCLWDQAPHRPTLLLAGALAGFAVGTKYTGAIPLALGALVIWRHHGRAHLRDILRDTGIYALAGLLVFSPWMIKNVYYVGNPVFPFFYKWSIRPINPWIADAAAGYFRGLVEYAPRSGVDLLRLLWDIGVHGMDFGGGMDVLGNFGWALLFAALPALAWVQVAGRWPMPVRLLLVYAVGFFIPWGMSRPVLRFLLPLAPVLALLAAYAYEHGVRRQAAALRWTGQGVLAALALSGLWLFFYIANQMSLFAVPLGFQTRSAYLAKTLDYYKAAAFLNALPDGTRAYVVGDQRGYYYNKPVIVTPVFNTNPLVVWSDEAASSEALAARLKAHGITHFLVNDNEMKRLQSAYGLYAFSPRGRRNWDRLRAKSARSVYRDDACEVLAL